MVSTVIAVPQQVQDIWLQKALEIKFAPTKTNLEAAFEVKTLDVKTVSVRSPYKSVLEVRHDLLPGDVGHDHHVPHQPGCLPDCPLHAEMSLKVFDVSLSESPVSNPSLALTPSRPSPLLLIFHLRIESVKFHKNLRSFGFFDQNLSQPDRIPRSSRRRWRSPSPPPAGSCPGSSGRTCRKSSVARTGF